MSGYSQVETIVVLCGFLLFCFMLIGVAFQFIQRELRTR